MSKQLVKHAAPRASVKSRAGHGEAIAYSYRADLLKSAQAEHQARHGQDVREYASFVPIDARMHIASWPQL